ncbi:DivIVA domain-containing protein [Micromonospora sp. HM5-17]|uniref:DivIVA domain-containing protein n=1 Tax=Micromonospora sp. HM5-17 TaxID=2487710 RepID=UPI000F4A64F6|nr:DivIVA domain-containing protein [Micromonospora sp. HM5-17]ROT25862.1 DivIVA domain-containing protein [Micromonospora sp. HM5-17]
MIYRSGQRILSYQVRAKTFGRRRRGLDPDEVYVYLRDLADERPDGPRHGPLERLSSSRCDAERKESESDDRRGGERRHVSAASAFLSAPWWPPGFGWAGGRPVGS